MHLIILVNSKGTGFWSKAIEYEKSAFKDDTWRWMMGKTWLREMGVGILNDLAKNSHEANSRWQTQ